MISGPLAVGQQLDTYELVEKLGQGGMGTVWKARHVRLDKMVALKVLPPHLTSDPEMVRRFEREMRAVGKVEHPNVVRAMDAREVNGLHFLVMEYVEGIDLSKYVKQRGPRTISDACTMVRHAALGLAAAHAQGLIHRDIKPSNLLLSKQGQVKVLDLGLARLLAEGPEARQLTQSGQVLGTPDYMAPEQWEDTRNCDHRTDLYALGCTLSFLLTAEAPYGDERHTTLGQKMKGHLLEAPPRLSDLRADVPVELELLYQQLMAKEVAQRPDSAADLAERLKEIINHLSMKGSAVRAVELEIPKPPEGAAVSSPQPLVVTIHNAAPHNSTKRTKRPKPQNPGASKSIGGIPRRVAIVGLCIITVLALTIFIKDPFGFFNKGTSELKLAGTQSGGPERTAQTELPPASVPAGKSTASLNSPTSKKRDDGKRQERGGKSATSGEQAPVSESVDAPPKRTTEQPAALPEGTSEIAGARDPAQAPPTVSPANRPAEETKLAPISTDRAELERLRQDAIARGDLPAALRSIEGLAALDSTPVIREKLAFLESLDPLKFPKQSEVLLSSISLLEQAAMDGEKEIVAKYLNSVLAKTREIGDRTLERRATRIALKGR